MTTSAAGCGLQGRQPDENNLPVRPTNGELWPPIESTARKTHNPRFRAIAVESMGGQSCPLRHLEQRSEMCSSLQSGYVAKGWRKVKTPTKCAKTIVPSHSRRMNIRRGASEPVLIQKCRRGKKEPAAVGARPSMPARRDHEAPTTASFFLSCRPNW